MLRAQDIGSLVPKNPRHQHLYATTRAYFEGTIETERVSTLAEALSVCDELVDANRACVLLGGSKPAGFFPDLNRGDGVDVLWYGPFIPVLGHLLSVVAALYVGLVLIEKPAALVRALPAMADLALVELFSFPKDRLRSVRRHVRWRFGFAQLSLGQVIGRDASYFSFGLDTDQHPCPAWCSWGDRCPDALRAAISPYLASK